MACVAFALCAAQPEYERVAVHVASKYMPWWQRQCSARTVEQLWAQVSALQLRTAESKGPHEAPQPMPSTTGFGALVAAYERGEPTEVTVAVHGSHLVTFWVGSPHRCWCAQKLTCARRGPTRSLSTLLRLALTRRKLCSLCFAAGVHQLSSRLVRFPARRRAHRRGQSVGLHSDL